MPASIPPASPRELLPILLAALPSSDISTEPPPSLLPLLSPILRQRVQIFTSTSREPWLPLLCYDSAHVSKLKSVVRDDRLQPHPASGEIELDWDHDVEVRYRRLDVETLQSFVSMPDLGLRVRLVWCVNDPDGSADGWRIGEVNALEDSGSSASELASSVGEAETRFRTETSMRTNGLHSPVVAGARGGDVSMSGGGVSTGRGEEEDEEEDDDDDAYWAQYDNTPARTPAQKRSPAPMSMQARDYGYSYSGDGKTEDKAQDAAEEDAYFSQYAQVQPAMDSHDPDEEEANGPVESTLGQNQQQAAAQQGEDEQQVQRDLNSLLQRGMPSEMEEKRDAYEGLEHPRPSSASSSGSGGGRRSGRSSRGSSDTVARLEREAEAQDRSEIGIKQHISTSMKSLFRLARAAGIERQEFERLVRTELDVLGLMEEDD